MRRLPGPADSRLSEGDHPPEALYELFRDWQRTQTQSSVRTLRSLRQQMDVWFCRVQEPMLRGIFCVLNILDRITCTLSRACPGHPCLRLTDDLHGCRRSGSWPLAIEQFGTDKMGNSLSDPKNLLTPRLSLAISRDRRSLDGAVS
jgi:hypothetical protein